MLKKVRLNFIKNYGVYTKKKGMYYVCVNGLNIVEIDDLLSYLNTFSLFRKSSKCNLIEEYNKDIRRFNEFKTMIGYDFKKVNYSINKMALHLFQKYNTNNIIFDETTKREEKFILDSNRGGVRFSSKGVYHNMIKLDVNSFYSKFLSSKIYNIPIGTPIEREITQRTYDSNARFNFGLYRCKIEGDSGKLFKLNQNNIYTHLDLQVAKLQGMKITKLDDTYLYYPKKVKACKIFGKFIYRLYKYKHDADLVKPVMNRLWGFLGSKTTLKLTTEKEFRADNITDLNLTNFDMKTGQLLNFQITKEEKYFKYNACRITPFITAYRRNFLYKLLKPFEKDIAYIHTDGWIMKNPGNITEIFDMGDKMGQLKIEPIFRDNANITSLRIINAMKFEKVLV